MPCRQLGHEVSIFTFALGSSSRSLAAPFSISSCLRKRTWVEMSGRATASVPDSPQQRSDRSTRVPISSLATLIPECTFIGVWQGSWYMYLTPCAPSSLTPFSIRYSWMSSRRQPGKMRSNSYFCSWSMQVPQDTITVLMSR